MKFLPSMKRRVLNLLIALDQFVFVLVTLGHANPDETISSAAWRWERDGKWNAFMRPLIDRMFSWLEVDHCRKSYKAEVSHA